MRYLFPTSTENKYINSHFAHSTRDPSLEKPAIEAVIGHSLPYALKASISAGLIPLNKAMSDRLRAFLGGINAALPNALRHVHKAFTGHF